MDALSQLDPRIKKIELSDIYQNNFTFNFLFQDPTTNLSNETVEPIRQKIVRMAENEFQAQLVGQI
jgi:phenylalanyl-tRNA synthetase beta subunit